MKKTLSYLKSYKKECILAPLFKLLEACFELFVPLVIADIIDIGISGGNKGYVWGRVGILALLAFCGLAFAITAQYFAAKAAVGFASHGQTRNFHAYNPYDGRRRTGSAGREHGFETAFALPVRRVRGGDNGVHRRREKRRDVCGHDTRYVRGGHDNNAHNNSSL